MKKAGTVKLKVVETPGRTELELLVDDYLEAGRGRGWSRKTIRESYGYPLHEVLLPWARRERITSAAQLDNKALARLSGELFEKGGKRKQQLSRHTVHTYMRAVNQLLAWAKKEGAPVNGYAPLPKLPKKDIDVLSREEIQRMEDAATSPRDALIIRLLAFSGIRVGELVNLRVDDLTERDRNHYILVREGKGRKDRLVPVPRLYRALERYAQRQRPEAKTDRLFVSVRRGYRSGEFERLTASGVEQMVRNVAEKAGIKKRVHPHLFRHSFATWQLQKGTNPLALKEMLGHSSLDMISNVYSHLSPSDVHEAMVRSLREED